MPATNPMSPFIPLMSGECLLRVLQAWCLASASLAFGRDQEPSSFHISRRFSRLAYRSSVFPLSFNNVEVPEVVPERVQALAEVERRPVVAAGVAQLVQERARRPQEAPVPGAIEAAVLETQ